MSSLTGSPFVGGELLESSASAPSPIKPGVKTSEFWLSTAATIFFALLGAGVFPSTPVWVQTASVVAAALTALGYGNARAVTKAGAGRIIGMLLVAWVLFVGMAGCQVSPTANPKAPNLAEVISAQLALIRVESVVARDHKSGKIGPKEYAAAIAVDKSASAALDIAYDDAIHNMPMSAGDLAAIQKSFVKDIATAIIAANPSLAGTSTIQDVLNELTAAPTATQPATQP